MYTDEAILSSPVGTYPITPTAAGTNLANYTVVINTGTLTVVQGTPVVTWNNPASIIYGTALSATQLNATASVPGGFVYIPAAGAVLNAGTQTLSVTFTPTDATDYKSVTQTVQIVVNKATLTVTAADANRVYNTANPTFTGTVTGAVNGDTFTESFTTAAILSSPVGTYPITPTATGVNLANYTVVINTGTLTVTQGTPVVTWNNPASITLRDGAVCYSTQCHRFDRRRIRLYSRRRSRPQCGYPDSVGHLHPNRHHRLQVDNANRSDHCQQSNSDSDGSRCQSRL